MECFKYLIQLFNTKRAIVKQISLFSLIGIAVILFNIFSSSWINLFIDKFYLSSPANSNIVNLCFAGSLFIGFYLVGYRYKFVESILNSSNVIMPDYTLEPISAIIKLLPIVLTWIIYYLIMIAAANTILYKYQNAMAYNLFYTVMICLIPFVLIIFCKFSSNYRYQKKYFNPLYLIKIIDKTLGRVIILSVESLLPAILMFGIIFLLYKNSAHIKSDVLSFSIKYFGIILSAYFLVILKYVYFIGLAKITKDKIMNV